jgi:hypothetical protein
MANEIILYSPDDQNESISVKIENETVWLSLNQISQLFNRDKSVISRHLKNIFHTGELLYDSTVAKNATVQFESGRQVVRDIEYYNLDAILSVGYRVNSKQGTQFRIWANNVLKDYLLKGYTINNRINRLEDSLENINSKLNEIELQINSYLIPNQGVFFEGQIFDAYELTCKIIKSATNTIILIDNYIDESTLTHLSKRNKNVKVIIYTKTISTQLSLDLKKVNEQYGNFDVKIFKKSHDRFLIIDHNNVFHLGASLKDLGKKWFAYSKLNKNSILNILNAIDNTFLCSYSI